jgi:hypothetical protein
MVLLRFQNVKCDKLLTVNRRIRVNCLNAVTSKRRFFMLQLIFMQVCDFMNNFKVTPKFLL